MRFGEFETVLELGRGGMANLFVARPASNHAGPATLVKTLRPPINAKRIAMFHDEGRFGLLLQHPNLVATLALGETGGVPFLVLELLDGQTLDRVLTQATPADRPLLLRAMLGALAGLDHVHRLEDEGRPLGIVHRDVSPQNVFLTYDGTIKVLDFGIAKATTGGLSRTTTGNVRGKLRYMAPEQALGLTVDRRADIFSLGAILLEIHRGQPLWAPTLADGEIFDDLVGGNYPTPPLSGSEPIERLLERALARDAAERPRSADDLARDLAAALGAAPAGDDSAAIAALLARLFPEQSVRLRRAIAAASS